jgi:mannose/fructose/N-acetylgalactosamine-specific phosphotransferase system component IIB
MAVVLFRIDDRLIHGQVVEGWLSNIRVDAILVANDLVAHDDMQKTLMSMAIPQGIEVFIDTVNDALKQLKQGVFEKRRTLILVESPKDAYLLLNGGVTITSLNVGGMHFRTGKLQICEYISIDDEDKKYFKQIAEKGIKIEGRTIPDMEKLDIVKELSKI